MPLPNRDNLAPPPSREREDELDWRENQSRTPEDQRRVDGAFLFVSATGTLFWLLIGLGTVGGIIAAGIIISRLWLRG